MFDHDRTAHTGGLDKIIFAGNANELAAGVAEPVHMLHGVGDRTAPIANARDLATKWGWMFEALDHAGHQALVSQPQRVWDWLEANFVNDEADEVPSLSSPRTLAT